MCVKCILLQQQSTYHTIWCYKNIIATKQPREDNDQNNRDNNNNRNKGIGGRIIVLVLLYFELILLGATKQKRAIQLYFLDLTKNQKKINVNRKRSTTHRLFGVLNEMFTTTTETSLLASCLKTKKKEISLVPYFLIR